MVLEEPKEGVKEETGEVETDAAVAGQEPPILDPIPATTPLTTEEPKLETVSGDEGEIDPKSVPVSTSTHVSESQAIEAPVSPDGSELGPVYTAESGGHLSGNAEEIAKRVFAAPVEGETATSTAPGTEELVDETANTEKAPVVEASTATVPATEVDKTVGTIEPPTSTKPDTPVAARIAPFVPAATTETTVSGPKTSKATKDKDSSKVSSWLKTKFSRRSSKAAKPEPSTVPGKGKEKGFIGGVNLTGPDTSKTSNTSSDHGDSSMREVAMAGKDTAPTTIEAPPVSPTVQDDLYSASDRSLQAGPTAAGALQRDSLSSPSISSLSSDEDTRGRSAVPREREPISQSEFVQEELDKGHRIDPALTTSTTTRQAAATKDSESSTTGGGDEFEEARDRFDVEKLSPPAAGILGGTGRQSDSPARDSKFSEDL